jgi:isopentenyldiphosphate isomerase
LHQADINIEDFRIDREEVEEIRWISKDQLLKEVEKSPKYFLITMNEWIEEFD